MPQQSDYRISIKPAPPGAFTLADVISSPRQCSPVDVKTASTSVELVAESPGLPRELAAFA